MDELLDVAAELLSVAVYAVGAVLAAALGIAAEYAGYQQFSAGTDITYAVWLCALGLVALYAASNFLAEFRTRIA